MGLLLRWKKIHCVYLIFLVLVPTIYLTGVTEWLGATSIDKFSWPLEFDADRLIKDYRSHSLNIKPINEINFKFTIVPKEACKDSKLLTVLIKTRVEDSVNREVLRRSWIKTLNNEGYRYAFVVGQCSGADKSDCKKNLDHESGTFGDILQADFIDSYKHNTYKTMTSLKYAAERCRSMTSYILLIDGDYSLNIHNLVAYIKYINKPEGLYGGKTWWDSQPFRLPLHKHYVSLSEYLFSQYPPFVTAGAILLSVDVAEKFYVASQFTKYYQFDDVFFGIVAKKVGVVPTDMGHLLPSYFNVPKMSDSRNKKLIGSHRFGKLNEVEHIYKEYGQQQHLKQEDI